MVGSFADLGAYFSFNGAFLEPRKSKIQAAFKRIPRERLLVETDAPAMPLPAHWQRARLPATAEAQPVNHPGNLVGAYEGLAELLPVPLQELAESCEENFRRLFLN